MSSTVLWLVLLDFAVVLAWVALKAVWFGDSSIGCDADWRSACAGSSLRTRREGTSGITTNTERETGLEPATFGLGTGRSGVDLAQEREIWL